MYEPSTYTGAPDECSRHWPEKAATCPLCPPFFTWEEHEGEPTFPSVNLGNGIVWAAHHGVSPGTDQIDGHLGERPLDIWFVDAPGNQDLRDEQPTIVTEAHEAWGQGRVLARRCPNGCTATAIFLPGEGFTEDVVLEAFRRFNP